MFFADRGAVSLNKTLAIQLSPLADLHPGVAAMTQLVFHLLPGSEQGDVICILVDGYGPVFATRAGNQA